MPRTIVIIPTYNEVGNIQQLLPLVLAQGDGLEILIVDDHSPDGTGAVVRAAIERDRRIHLIERSGKLGLGTAYVEGFKYAVAHGFDYAISMDADFSHDPGDIRRFLIAIEGADVVIGSRYVNGGRVLNWPKRRLALSYLANVYTRLVTGLPIRDATSGFKCYRRSVLEAFDLERMTSNGYAFQIETLFKAWRRGFTLVEVSITFLDRRAGESKMSEGIIYEALVVLWNLRVRSLFNRL